MFLANMMLKHQAEKTRAEGRAEGHAEGRAEGEAKVESSVQAWYDANKDKMGDVTPPPINGHRDQHVP